LNPQNLSNTSRTPGNPWVDQATEQVHFLNITNKDQVEPTLVRAQRAVLNPGKDWHSFVHEEQDEQPMEVAMVDVDTGRATWYGQAQHGSAGWSGGFGDSKGKGKAVEKRSERENDFEVKFSPNVVCMEVSLFAPGRARVRADDDRTQDHRTRVAEPGIY
jgi:hypothetical protein